MANVEAVENDWTGSAEDEDFDEEEDDFVSSQTEQIQETIASEEKDEFGLTLELEDIVAADPTRKARGRYPDHPPHPTASSVHIAAHPHRRAASRSPHLHRHHQQ